MRHRTKLTIAALCAQMCIVCALIVVLYAHTDANLSKFCHTPKCSRLISVLQLIKYSLEPYCIVYTYVSQSDDVYHT